LPCGGLLPGAQIRHCAAHAIDSIGRLEIVIESEGVCKIFPGPDHPILALEDISFTIQTGEFVTITGDSGSGKSTLLSLLGAIDLPTSGSIRFDGVTFEQASSSRLAAIRLKQIGFVFQEFRLVRHLSVLENVRLPLLLAGKDPDNHSARDLLARFGIEHRMHHRPDDLSRGEMQRVALARAMINGPSTIIADEPSANLDARNRETIWSSLQELNRAGLTVIVATHSAELSGTATRTIRLDQGRISEET
jgi:putative ABC transport system ATP-binding protein